MTEPDKSPPERLLQSRKASEERTHLHRVGESLRKRLAPHFRAEPLYETPRVAECIGSHTESFNRVLLLWLDLQREFARARYAGKSNDKPNLVPWNCEDKEVSRLWEEITRPENSAALAEWHYQSAAGEAEIWSQQALTECWLRVGEK